ncbi:hypothetical protein [Hyphomicrobium sp. DMF-1]|uniref:hypothetical protein n=1 Tax=Hyphomicrobium sp. DMF-1 TaxID=3019544 RepID=UPI0022EBFAAD|nr:hypothetical protein [Hyphomicrobium sp. DMF-1]WBT37980.1 hypothetical protein PE058_20340 [Hyphomicrobium sp. DMF-1]
MPRYRVTQYRDARQIFAAIIPADSSEAALALAEGDNCHWIPGDTHALDERDIPFDEIQELDDLSVVLEPGTIPTKIWLLHIDDGDNEPSVDIFSHKPSALIAFEAALTPYMTGEERRTFSGDPEAAYESILKREGGDLPYGHVCRLDEHRLSVYPATPA